LPDALLDFRGSLTAPAPATYIDAGYVTSSGECDGDIHLAGEARVDLQAVFLIAEAQLRLTRPHEVAEIANIATGAAEVPRSDHARGLHANRRSRHAPSATDAADSATATATGAQPAAKSAATGRTRALTALTVSNNGFATQPATARAAASATSTTRTGRNVHAAEDIRHVADEPPASLS
jgi:hypothetical protein